MVLLGKDVQSQANRVLTALHPAGIREFNNQLSSIPHLIKLTVGEPDLKVPLSVKVAATTSIWRNQSHYSAAAGILPLRKAAAKFMAKTQRVNYDPATEIITTVGSTEGLAAVIMGLFNPGDQVIVPTPAYPLYIPLLTFIGAQPVTINTAPERFKLTAARLTSELNHYPNARALILNYPHNPTGITYSERELRELARIIKARHLIVITDEIYGQLTYNQPHISLARFIPERTVVVTGLSKSHAMTGYRIGTVVGPEALMQKIAKLHSYLVTAPSNPAQYAAVQAYRDIRAANSARSRYYKRQRYLTTTLAAMNVSFIQPQGAFYLFMRIPKHYGTNDREFALKLANQVGVGCIPGQIFGPGGAGYVRLSYATKLSQIKKAMKRLAAFLKQDKCLD